MSSCWKLLTLLCLPPMVVGLAGCQSGRGPAPGTPDTAGPTLTLVVSELQMHLNDDTYRTDRATLPDGRSLFEVALWRLERLQRARGTLPEKGKNVDIVIEYARGRALERLRRFSEAADAYDRVAQTGSLLADVSSDASFVMRRFAQFVGAPPAEPAGPGDQRSFLDQRVERWRSLAWEYRDTSYEPLALEEAEAWEILRVDWIADHQGLDDAIEACKRLTEHHGSSKLYARHLIRLGDLLAAAARREQVRSRAQLTSFDAARYESLLDQAFSAYELAREQRATVTRSQAQAKIDALLADHEGTLHRAR